jgi:hypothetical protein
MSAPRAQRPWRTSGSGSTNYVNPGMRVSDAERAEVTDRLSQHYSDGRLDQAEFDRRVEQAMNAKTRADLDGLFDDLPGGGPPQSPHWDGSGDPQSAPRRRYPRILPIVIAIVIAVVVGQAVGHLFIPWLLIAVVAFIWLRHTELRRRRY